MTHDKQREALIEKAAKAIVEVKYPEIAWGLLAKSRKKFYHKQACVAIAVFEKAHPNVSNRPETDIPTGQVSVSDGEREALIEEAAIEADRRWPSPNSGLYEGLISGFKQGARWVSEKALGEATVASTDDEREALALAVARTRVPANAMYAEADGKWPMWDDGDDDTYLIADSVIAAGFRRPVDPEPIEPTCEHGSPLSDLCDYAARYASGETDDPEPSHVEPQGEPSDVAGRIPGEPLTLEELAREHKRLAEHPNQMSQTVPAFHSLTAKALRWAAAAVTEQGESREDQDHG